MKKIAFVIQRYGADIVGGSESYCRQIATRLSEYYDVEILTSKAKDPATWRDEYDADIEEVDGLTVRRFSVEHEQQITPAVRSQCIDNPKKTLEDGYVWIEKLGPYCPSLIDYLGEHIDEYDTLVLMTYLYYPTVTASLRFGHKALMIPTAHDEADIYQPIYQEAFRSLSGIYFLTPEERAFFEDNFDVDDVRLSDGNGGVGVDLIGQIDEAAFRERYGLENSPYILYAGRIDEAKGCKNLVRNFLEYKGRNPSDLKLILIGKQGIELPDTDDVRYLGFLSDEEKLSAMKGAEVFINPSRFESLSIVVLEAMAVGTPVLVNGDCVVLKGHCQRSNAGFYFTNYLEFEKLLNLILGDADLKATLQENAIKYVDDYYTWGSILRGLRLNIDSVIERQSVF